VLVEADGLEMIAYLAAVEPAMTQAGEDGAWLTKDLGAFGEPAYQPLAWDQLMTAHFDRTAPHYREAVSLWAAGWPTDDSDPLGVAIADVRSWRLIIERQRASFGFAMRQQEGDDALVEQLDGYVQAFSPTVEQLRILEGFIGACLRRRRRAAS
jgi:hypothetical protein